ncbi:MAG: divergent polysaccharide deacetylase family protein [Cognatishimia sp.]|uniref:divergent polysaccharide deacetylase family protein n=1 Tax=Cognatishimia sp. TaxID=2211648 RepID=UPI003B8D9036
MLRGIFTGLFFGGVLGLMLAGVVSLLAPLPSNVAVPQAQGPATAAPEAAVNTPLAVTSDTDAPVNADATAQTPAAVEGADGAPVADFASAPKPNTSTVADTPSAPAQNGAVDVAVNSESPVLPNPQANAIASPGADDEPSISVDPAQPLSPQTADTQAFDNPEAVADEGAEAAPAVVESGADIVAPDVSDEETTSLLKPVTGFQESFTQHTSTRLPTVYAEADQPATEDVAVEMAKPPLEAFSTAFEGEADKPLLSIVLLDDPAAGIDLQTLAEFPMPMSIAVNAQSADALARAAALRGAGLEVLALMDFPVGATASDVAVNIESQLANVPEAVALMDGFDGGVQENRAVSDQVIAYALSSGHGVVFQPKGLNTAQKLAVREGVGAVTVFRDFDGSGQSDVVIRRFLDQAAFKARQNEAVLMLGRMQNSTIAALASWALQDRASTVSIAPVSALLAQTVQ